MKSQSRNRNHLPLGWVIARYPLLVVTYLLGVPVLWLLEKLALPHPVISALRRMERINSGRLGSFKSYTPNKHDVMVCVYTKSGTNWAMHMAHQIAWRGQGEFEHIHDVIPWPDEMIPGYTIDLFDRSPQISSPTGLRVIKTHLEWDNIPYSEDAKYITVIRDPKDVFVSHYFFFKSIMFGPIMPSVSRWFDFYLSDKYFVGSWASHVNKCWNMRNRKNVLLLLFKDMKNDLHGAAERMARFMEVDLTPDELKAVCEKCTFKYMQSIDHKFYAGIVTPWSSRQGKMLRKGGQKDSSELLTPAQQKRMDAYFKNALKAMNSDFPYDEVFEVKV